jgi:hypothetical protein
MVIGDNPEEQLLPFCENIENLPKRYLKFEDVEAEELKKYETGSTLEFYDESNSSWGMEVSSLGWDELEKASEGDEFEFNIEKTYAGQYFRRGSNYKCYKTGGNQYPDKVVWLNVLKVLQTDHPDKDVYFTGTILVKIIAPPKEVPFKQKYPTFEIYMKDYCGYESRDKKKGKYGYWHNPNAKWDWYQLGGRWVGFLKAKKDAKTKIVGSKSLLMKEGAKEGYFDKLLLKDIDIEGIKKDAQEKGAKAFDKVVEVVKGRSLPTWKEIREKYPDDIDKAREEYNSNPVIIDLKKADLLPFFGDPVELYKGFDREKYLTSVANSVLSTHAILKDGKWYERGEMGWFGCVSDEKDKDIWDKEVIKLLEGLPKNTLISIYDCHI